MMDPRRLPAGMTDNGKMRDDVREGEGDQGVFVCEGFSACCLICCLRRDSSSFRVETSSCNVPSLSSAPNEGLESVRGGSDAMASSVSVGFSGRFGFEY